MKRYELDVVCGGEGDADAACMTEDASGDWVPYEDAVALIKAAEGAEAILRHIDKCGVTNRASAIAWAERLRDALDATKNEPEQLRCACCGHDEPEVAIRRIMCREPVCAYCLRIWRDHCETDPEKVKEESLKLRADKSSESLKQRG